LRGKIDALINARKVAGVHAGSNVYLQNNARAKGVYGAAVEGHNGTLYVRIGGGDSDWQPSDSGYQDYRDYAHGTGWKVWVKIPGNPEVRQAKLHDAFPVPTYTPPETISAPPQPSSWPAKTTVTNKVRVAGERTPPLVYWLANDSAVNPTTITQACGRT
jgi:hypothetical protein